MYNWFLLLSSLYIFCVINMYYLHNKKTYIQAIILLIIKVLSPNLTCLFQCHLPSPCYFPSLFHALSFRCPDLEAYVFLSCSSNIHVSSFLPRCPPTTVLNRTPICQVKIFVFFHSPGQIPLSPRNYSLFSHSKILSLLAIYGSQFLHLFLPFVTICFELVIFVLYYPLRIPGGKEQYIFYL